MLNSGLPVFPENQQWVSGPVNPIEAEEKFKSLSPEEKTMALNEANDWVIEFPQTSPTEMNSSQESAVSQFNRYLEFIKNYADHNVSISIYVGDDEWDTIAQMVYDNWDDYVAVSFFPKSQETKKAYALAPYETITKKEYDERMKQYKGIDYALLEELEFNEYERNLSDITDPSCATGICPVR